MLRMREAASNGLLQKQMLPLRYSTIEVNHYPIVLEGSFLLHRFFFKLSGRAFSHFRKVGYYDDSLLLKGYR